MVYQGRIFHSQHVGLQQQPEMYDSGYRLPRAGSYMDIYGLPYNYDPTVAGMYVQKIRQMTLIFKVTDSEKVPIAKLEYPYRENGHNYRSRGLYSAMI